FMPSFSLLFCPSSMSWFSLFFFYGFGNHRDLHSFPTRRSSDLGMFLANLLACLGFAPVICLVYIGFLMNSLLVMVASAAVGGILAGPVLAGMYDTVLRALRDEPGYWWTTYRRAFRQNFKASILPGIFYCVIVTLQIFVVYFCFNMLAQGVNVGTGMWVAAVLNLLVFHMLFAYMWPQVVLLDQPFRQTLAN